MNLKNYAWHNLKPETTVKILKTNAEKGLSLKEVAKRRLNFGKNSLPSKKGLSGTTIILDQLKSPLIFILLIAGAIVLFFKEFNEAVVIFGVVFLNTLVGYFQESKASQALKKLKKAVRVKAKIIRKGNFRIVDSEELVPGDIVLLEPGDKTPADLRIIEARDLKVNEMSLTGEWLAAEKTKEKLPKETVLADRDNMLYMGTTVESGRARAVVVSIGLGTEIGKVAQMVKKTKERKTPLQMKLIRFARLVGIIIVLVSVIIFISGAVVGKGFLEMFIVSVAVAVAAIPEGLPVAMTVILALGVQRILKRKGLVRKLRAAETLGGTSIICTDKTLTLTEGKMKVARILTQGQLLGISKKGNDLSALKIAALASEAFIENPGKLMEKAIVRGRPTDRALLLAGREAGIKLEKLKKNLLDEIPFNSKNKYLAKVFSSGREEKIVYFSGAPEKVLESSKYLRLKRKNKFLTVKTREEIKKRLEELAKKGLRVVAVGYKKTKKTKNSDISFDNLIFVGLIALKDPVRKEVKKAIKICRTAGLRPVIITGDHKLTAKAVAEELGMKIKEENIMEGGELDKISDKEFKKKVKDIEIYARVEPKHKMRVVEAWQDLGEVVAMTGDGINDAPALKKADIGIALGSGSEAAKEVSDLVLLNNNFNVIVAAVEEGRAIIDNIRKVITYLLTDSFTETVLVGATLIFGFPLPVSAVQILWVNLIEDGLPGVALSFEPKEKDLMRQKPKGLNVPLLNQEMKVIIFAIGLISNFLLLGLFFWLLAKGGDIFYIRTMVFAALTVDSLFYVFSCKSLRKNIWNINLFSSKLLIFAWALGIITLIGTIYLPLFQTLLKTVPLGFGDWLIVMSLGLIELILIEAVKWFFISSKIKKQNIK